MNQRWWRTLKRQQDNNKKVKAMEDIELIRQVLQIANEKGVEGASAAMEALVRVNTQLLEQDEELQIIKGVLAHG